MEFGRDQSWAGVEEGVVADTVVVVVGDDSWAVVVLAFLEEVVWPQVEEAVPLVAKQMVWAAALVDCCSRNLAAVDPLVAFQAGKVVQEVEDSWGLGSGAKVVGAACTPWEVDISTAVVDIVLAVVVLEVEEHEIAFLRIVGVLEEVVVVVELGNCYPDTETGEAVLLQDKEMVEAVLPQDMGRVEVDAVDLSSWDWAVEAAYHTVVGPTELEGEPGTHTAADSGVADSARFLVERHADCSCHWPVRWCRSGVSELHQQDEVVEEEGTGKVASAAGVEEEKTFQEDSNRGNNTVQESNRMRISINYSSGSCGQA